MPEQPPKVFISYSYDSSEHEKWIEDLATFLRSNGIESVLDRWHFRLGKPSAMDMNDAISSSDRVLCICTDRYNQRVDEGKGGAGYEGCLITAQLVQDAATDKFIPVIRNVSGPQKTPKCLAGRNRVDLSEGDTYARERERLVKDLHNTVEIPPVGLNPYSSSVSNTALDQPHQVGVLRAANLQVVFSETCVDVKAAHGHFLNFPDVENCPKELQSSHFYVKSNDVLMGRKFSKIVEATHPEDWCYLGVFLKNDKNTDAYSEMILRLLSDQNEKKWVFYGHKDQLRLERRTEAIYSSPPYSQDYRIPVIRPQGSQKSRFLGVVKIWKNAEFTNQWDRVFTYALLYRIQGAEIQIAEGEIPIEEKLQNYVSSVTDSQ